MENDLHMDCFPIVVRTVPPVGKFGLLLEYIQERRIMFLIDRIRYSQTVMCYIHIPFSVTAMILLEKQHFGIVIVVDKSVSVRLCPCVMLYIYITLLIIILTLAWGDKAAFIIHGHG